MQSVTLCRKILQPSPSWDVRKSGNSILTFLNLKYSSGKCSVACYCFLSLSYTCRDNTWYSSRSSQVKYGSIQACNCVCPSADMSSEGVYPSLFMSALSNQSDRTLSLCWEQHCKLLPGVQGIHANQVAAWSVEEVSQPAHLFVFFFFWLEPLCLL